MNLKKSLILILIILFLFIGLLNAESQTNDVISLVENGDYSAASVEMLKINDENFPVKYWSGRIQYGLRKYADAAKLFESSFLNDENGNSTIFWWARSLRNSGCQNKAISLFKIAYNKDKNNQIIIGEYAAIKVLAGDYSEASKLFSLISSKEIISKAEKWRELLKPLVKSMDLEPPKLYEIDGMIICSDDKKKVADIEKIALKAKIDVEKAMNTQLPSFRLLIFSSYDSYSKYSFTVHNKNKALGSPSFTLPGVIAIWNPSDWHTPPHSNTEVPGIIRHEMVHLAISVLTHGENVPLWLNEGLACKYGGGIEVKSPTDLKDKTFSEINILLNSNDEYEQLSGYYLAFNKVSVITKDMTIDDIHELLMLIADGESFEVAMKKISGKEMNDFFLENK
jgi:tetratricopeptide (TPR) repeat protein